MTVEAEGYDAAVSRIYELVEGDQELDFKLKRGGTVEGVARTPVGDAAAGAQLAFAIAGDGTIPCSQPGRLPRQMSSNLTSASGQFELRKLLLARSLVVFHEAGWAVVPIAPGPQKAEVSLSPWARIEGRVTIGNLPAPGRQITLENLTQASTDALYIYYRATGDDEGHFVFDKVPAGIFKLTCRETGAGKWEIPTLQTSVSVEAGETKSVEMGASGRTVAAQLRAPAGLAAINWSNVLATLSADVLVPPEPARSDFISLETHEAARARYAHDPAVLAALEKQQTFAGSVGPDGMTVFQQVLPGNYVLEVKLFDPSKSPPPPNLHNEPAVVIARLRVAVSVPEAAGPSDNAAPAALGDYSLDPL